MKNIKEATKYAHKVADEVFFLRGWELSVVQSRKRDGEVASECFTRERYRQCQITVFPIFWTMPEDQQRSVIVHELCHNITGIQNGLIHSLLNKGKSTEAEMLEVYERETSWMANIIYRLMKK